MKKATLLLLCTFQFAILLAQDWSTRTSEPIRSFGFNFCETNKGFIGIGTDSLSFENENTGTALVKLSPCGTIQWELALSPPYPTNEFAGMAITDLNDSNYAGWSTVGTDSIYLFKINPEGEIIWDHLFSHDYYLSGIRPIAQIEEDEMGNIYVFTERVLYKFEGDATLIWSHDLYTIDNLSCQEFKLDADGNSNITGYDIFTGDTKLAQLDHSGELVFSKNSFFEYSTCLENLDDQIIVGGNIDQERVIRFFDLDGDSISSQTLPFYTDEPWIVDHLDETKVYITEMDLMTNGNLAMRSNHTSIYWAGFPWIYSSVFEYDFTTESIISETTIHDQYVSKISENRSGDVIGTTDGGFAAFGSSYSAADDNYQMTVWKFKDNCDLSTSNQQSKTYSLYPNPTSGVFYLNVPSHFVGDKYTIKDIMGKSISSGLIESESFAINFEAKPGYYFIQSNADPSFSLKFCIQ